MSAIMCPTSEELSAEQEWCSREAVGVATPRAGSIGERA